MKRFTGRHSFFIPSALSLIAALSSTGSARSQTIFTSTIAPTTGSKDVYDLSANGGFDGSRDFSNNPTPGETFTPTSSGSLTSISVKGVGNAANFSAGTWNLRVSTVSGTTLTNSATYSFSAAPTANSADSSGTANAGWLTFDLPTSYAVTAGTTYAYDIYAQNGFYGFARDFSHVGTGGAFNTGTAGAFTSTTITPYSPTNVNRTFIAGITTPTLIVASSSAPTVTGATIAQTASGGPFSGSTNYSDNPTPGQAFTTGANPLGYSLNSVTLLGSGDAGNAYNTGIWHLRISSLSGTTLTPIGTYSFDPTTITSSSQYLTFTLPSVTLNANTTYAYDVTADNGYFGFADATTAGANDIGNIGAYFNTGLARSFDSQTANVTTGLQRTFYANLTSIGGAAAPEPSALALLASVAGAFGVGTIRRRRSQIL